MVTPILLTETLLEATTGHYSFPLVDASGAGIDGSIIETLTVKLYDLDTLQVLNGRDNQDIKNTNDGTIITDPGPPIVSTVTLNLQPADTIILNQSRWVEYRILVFRWSWNSGMRHSAHAVQFGIENLELFL
jgi:hypothetical protein